jgi:hypothetical protein
MLSPRSIQNAYLNRENQEIGRLVVKPIAELLEKQLPMPHFGVQHMNHILRIFFHGRQHPDFRLIRLGWLGTSGAFILEHDFGMRMVAPTEHFLQDRWSLWFENHPESIHPHIPHILTQAIKFISCHISRDTVLGEGVYLQSASGREELRLNVATSTVDAAPVAIASYVVYIKNLAFALLQQLE